MGLCDTSLSSFFSERVTSTCNTKVRQMRQSALPHDAQTEGFSTDSNPYCAFNAECPN